MRQWKNSAMELTMHSLEMPHMRSDGFKDPFRAGTVCTYSCAMLRRSV